MSSVSSTAIVHPEAPKTPPRRFRWIRFSLLALLLCALSLLEPRVFQFAVEHLIRLIAWKQGAEVRIASVQGSFWKPVVLLNSRWNYDSADGSRLRLDIERAEGGFHWRDVFSKTGRRWFRHLTIHGVTGNLECAEQTHGSHSREEHEERAPSWDWLPERVEIHNTNFLATTNGNSVRIVNGSCLLSTINQGHIRAEQLVVRQPWLSHTFRDVQGTSALQGSQIILAEVALEPGILVRSFSAKLPELVNGRLDAKAEIAAFGGVLRVQAQTLRRDGGRELEISVHPSEIGIAPLANFLKLSEAAGGTIKTGRFTFRGSPVNLPKATATLRLEATNFQWESRQWDSLVLGATLLNRRLSIPELALHQGANRLNLNGELELPKAGESWWNSDFSLNITARLENLTDLSALMLPEFRYVAGKMNIDGSVRGTDQKLSGAMILSGADITWRNTPIEELHAAIRLNGNEMQIVNLEMLDQDDFIRGRGTIHLFGQRQYSGEVKANIQDLAKYAAILRPPIVPEPLAGGGFVTWSGKGSAKEHAGNFSARLHQLRTLGSTAAMLHPLSALLDGSYGGGGIEFSRFSLADEESAFSAKAVVRNKALSLTDIRLTHGDEVWLEGSATLPLDIHRAWPNTSPATLLTDGVPSKVDLVARNLQLRRASRLTGWKWPIEGVLNGTVKAEGPIGAIQSSGTLTLKDGRIPLGWTGNHLGAVDAEMSLAGQTLTINAFHCQHSSGSYTATGEIDFTNIRDTQLKISVQSDKFIFEPFLDFPAGAQLALDLNIAGPASAATVSGTAKVMAIRPDAGVNTIYPTVGLDLLWSEKPNAPLPPLRRYSTAPYANWKFAVNTDPTQRTTVFRDSELSTDLRLSGTGAFPILTGTLELTGSAQIGGTKLAIDSARLEFREAAQQDPAVMLLGRGQVAGEPFYTLITGTLTHPIRVVNAATPALTELAFAALAGQQHSPEAFAMDRHLPELLHIDVVPWPTIEVPTEPPPAPEPEEAPEPAPEDEAAPAP